MGEKGRSHAPHLYRGRRAGGEWHFRHPRPREDPLNELHRSGPPQARGQHRVASTARRQNQGQPTKSEEAVAGFERRATVDPRDHHEADGARPGGGRRREAVPEGADRTRGQPGKVHECRRGHLPVLQLDAKVVFADDQGAVPPGTNPPKRGADLVAKRRGRFGHDQARQASFLGRHQHQRCQQKGLGGIRQIADHPGLSWGCQLLDKLIQRKRGRAGRAHGSPGFAGFAASPRGVARCRSKNGPVGRAHRPHKLPLLHDVVPLRRRRRCGILHLGLRRRRGATRQRP